MIDRNFQWYYWFSVGNFTHRHSTLRENISALRFVDPTNIFSHMNLRLRTPFVIFFSSFPFLEQTWMPLLVCWTWWSNLRMNVGVEAESAEDDRRCRSVHSSLPRTTLKLNCAPSDVSWIQLAWPANLIGALVESCPDTMHLSTADSNLVVFPSVLLAPGKAQCQQQTQNTIFLY